MTTISYPCPGCSADLVFERATRHGRISARCDRCEVVYTMSSDGVRPLEDQSSAGPTRLDDT